VWEWFHHTEEPAVTRTRFATRTLYRWLTAETDPATLDRCLGPFTRLPSREMLVACERFLRDRFLGNPGRATAWNEFAVGVLSRSVDFRRLAVRLLVERVLEYVPGEAVGHDPQWWGPHEPAGDFGSNPPGAE
jgi:hypothetical protein